MEEFICGGYEKGTLGSGLLTKTYLLEHNWVHDSDWSLDHDDRKSASVKKIEIRHLSLAQTADTFAKAIRTQAFLKPCFKLNVVISATTISLGRWLNGICCVFGIWMQLLS
uniref:Uncharacterized protein n=1 Tax=Cucumis melo TaxID=3656 RepID=A0A9I9EIX5_CUCME